MIPKSMHVLNNLNKTQAEVSSKESDEISACLVLDLEDKFPRNQECDPRVTNTSADRRGQHFNGIALPNPDSPKNSQGCVSSYNTRTLIIFNTYVT